MSTLPYLAISGTDAIAASALSSVLQTPSGIQVGDYLLVLATNQTQPSADWTLPSGWARVGTPYVAGDADQRGTGIFAFPIPDQATLSALPASWTFTSPATDRKISGIRVFRQVDLSSPVGGYSAKSTSATNVRTMPSFTVARDNSLLVFAANNQVTSPNASTATVTDSTTTSIMDNTTAGDTTVSRTSLKAWTKPVNAGASGTQVVTWAGAATGASIMSVALNPIVPVTVDYTASWWDGTTEKPAALTWANGTGGETAVPKIDFQPRVLTVAQLLALPRPINFAHRGGSFNWCEFTLRAYRESAMYWLVDAVEVSVQVSADGTFWCNHDADLTYATNGATTATVASLTDAQLSAIMVTAAHTDNTSQPTEHLVTLQQVVDFLPGVVIAIEDKTYAHQVQLMNFINANGGASRFIWKQSGPGTRYPGSSSLTAWGYFFSAEDGTTDMNSFAAKQSQWEYVGLSYTLSDSELDAAVATAGSGRVITHILVDAPNLARMNARHVRGNMIANVRALVPRAL